ncbi:phosphodiester glycosidase family protein [Hymenobacter taeanensis]|nr:phosphodiester glycosidase family protein [Hymenobacter taeanensis]UOQ81220.1 phosphodiester glycosidase family protein [Hymenobacter sp. 5414T-23]
MYKADNTPLGLFVEQGVPLTPIDTASGEGNFYLKPNGVFFLTTNGKAGITPTVSFPKQHIQYATQSGPMLVLQGRIHPAFKAHSTNLNIRNGVGILPDGTVLFVMSKQKVSLYDFALYFQQQGCQTALYLDGFVSRAYLPEQEWRQTDGDFGVIIGVTRSSQ